MLSPMQQQQQHMGYVVYLHITKSFRSKSSISQLSSYIFFCEITFLCRIQTCRAAPRLKDIVSATNVWVGKNAFPYLSRMKRNTIRSLPLFSQPQGAKKDRGATKAATRCSILMNASIYTMHQTRGVSWEAVEDSALRLLFAREQSLTRGGRLCPQAF